MFASALKLGNARISHRPNGSGNADMIKYNVSGCTLQSNFFNIIFTSDTVMYHEMCGSICYEVHWGLQTSVW